jgi:hypothetical protein
MNPNALAAFATALKPNGSFYFAEKWRKLGRTFYYQDYKRA